MSRKREKPLRIVRPCCSASRPAELLWPGSFHFPHLPHCPRYRRPVDNR